MLVECEDVIVEDERGYVLIIGEEVGDFIKDFLNRVLAQVAELGCGKVMAFFVGVNDSMVKAIGAALGAAAGRHEPDPSLFLIDEFLKVEEGIIFSWKIMDVGEGSEGIFEGGSLLECPDAGDRCRVFVVCEFVGEGGDNVFVFAESRVVEEAAL